MDALPPLARRDPKWLLIAAVLASSMGFIDSSVTAIALPAIRSDLGGSLTAIAWVHGSYLLTLSALILTGGALSDRIGIVTAFKAGIAGFTLASVLCALAPSVPWLIAARLLQGMAAAFMVPGSMTLVSRAYGAGRGRALGLWAAASTATTAGGPLLCGLLLTLGPPETWRLIFAINLPFYALAWMAMGRAFTLKTFAAVTLLSALTSAIPRWAGFAQLDPWFAAIAGGLLMGAGFLVLFRHHASLGGLNILVLVLQKRFGWRAGWVQMGIDGAILLASLAMVEPGRILMSIAGAVALNLTLALNHRPGRYVAF